MSNRDSEIQKELRQSSPFSSPAQEAFVGLMKTASRLQRKIAELLDPYDITPQQYNVLRILRGAGTALPTMEIGERMIEETPGITRLLDRLELKRLVTRTRCPEDRRQVLCSITPDGLALLKKLDQPVIEFDTAALIGLDESQLEHLILLLDTIRRNNP